MQGLSIRETNPIKRAMLYVVAALAACLYFAITAAAVMSPFAVVWFAALHWK